MPLVSYYLGRPAHVWIAAVSRRGPEQWIPPDACRRGAFFSGHAACEDCRRLSELVPELQECAPTLRDCGRAVSRAE